MGRKKKKEIINPGFLPKKRILRLKGSSSGGHCHLYISIGLRKEIPPYIYIDIDLDSITEREANKVGRPIGHGAMRYIEEQDEEENSKED